MAHFYLEKGGIILKIDVFEEYSHIDAFDGKCHLAFKVKSIDPLKVAFQNALAGEHNDFTLDGYDTFIVGSISFRKRQIILTLCMCNHPVEIPFSRKEAISLTTS